MKLLSKISLGLGFVLLLSCSSLKVHKANELKTEKANQIAYCLPKANLLFTFTFDEQIYIPGPYNAYAKQFLELEPRPSKASKSWELIDIKHEVLSEKDTSQAYVITGCLEQIASENWTNLLAYQNSTNMPVLNLDKDHYNYHFNELTFKKLIIEDSKTSYKMVTVDSITKRVPVVNTVLRNKTTEELAKDAAKLLTKIRKRKFRLMAGMNDKFPEKGDIKLMLEELNKKEQYYLDLFLGKTESIKRTYQVLVKPESMGEQSIIAYDKYNEPNFNKSKSSLTLKISGMVAEKNNSDQNMKTEKFLPFKAPSNSLIEIKHHNKTIYSANVQLPQFAEIQYLPVKFLKQRTIELDSESGMLKKVQ
jgi:hypothetical protein